VNLCHLGGAVKGWENVGRGEAMPNTRNEYDAGFLPWEQGHPRDGEICLAVVSHRKRVYMSDDPVEFLGWLLEHYPIVLRSLLLEAATYQYVGSGPSTS
jgi:hypothetical protein